MACGDPRLVDPEHVATGIHDPKVAKTEIWDHLTKWSWNVMKRPRVFWERPIQSPPKNYEKKKQTHKSLKNHLKQEHIPNLIHQNVHVFFLGGGNTKHPKPKKQKQISQACFATTGTLRVRCHCCIIGYTICRSRQLGGVKSDERTPPMPPPPKK